MGAPGLEGDVGTAQAPLDATALTATLLDISQSLRKITQAWTDPSLHGGGNGLFQTLLDGRARETDHYAAVLEDRVQDVVEGYRKLNELAAQGPKLFKEAASVGGGDDSRRLEETQIESDPLQLPIEQISRSYDASYGALLDLHEERLALSRSFINDQTAPLYLSASKPAGGDNTKAPMNASTSFNLPSRRSRLSNSTGTQPLAVSSSTNLFATSRGIVPSTGKAAEALPPPAMDRPLPIPRFPTSYLHVEKPTRQLFWEAPAANVQNALSSSSSTMFKVQQGYVLPSEVQAALLLMPRPDPTSLRASGELGKQPRPSPVVGNLHSPPYQKKLGWQVKSKEEKMEAVKQSKDTAGAAAALRKKLLALEKREALSATTLAAIKDLLATQADRQKDLEGAINAIMDRIEEANRQQHVIELQVPPAPIDKSIPEPEEDDSPPVYRVLSAHQQKVHKTIENSFDSEAPLGMLVDNGLVEVLLGNVGRVEVGEGVNADDTAISDDEEGDAEVQEEEERDGPKKVVLRGEGREATEGWVRGDWEERFGTLRRKNWPLDVGLDDAVQRLIQAVLDSIPIDGREEKEDEEKPLTQEVVVLPPAKSPEPDYAAAEREAASREQERIAREAREAADALRREREALEEARRRAAGETESDRSKQADLLASMVGDLMVRVTAMESRPVPTTTIIQERKATPPPQPPPQPIVVQPPPLPQMVTRAIQVGRLPIPPPPAIPPPPLPQMEDDLEVEDFEDEAVGPSPERRCNGVWPWPSPPDIDEDSSSTSISSTSVHIYRTTRFQSRQEEFDGTISLASSYSEGQIYPEGPDDLSEGQLTRRYRFPSALVKQREGRHATTTAKTEVHTTEATEGWRLHSPCNSQSLYLSISEMDESTDEVGDVAEGAEVASLHGEPRVDELASALNAERSNAAARLRLLKWRHADT